VTGRRRDHSGHPGAVDALAALIGTAALALLAPLEWAAGQWLGLGQIHSGTITLVVEGFAALALVAGRLVPLALTLTTISAGIGMLHSASVQAATDGGRLDQARVGAALAVTALAVTAMAGTHHIRARTAQARARAVDRAIEEERRALEAERAHQLETARAEAARIDAERAAEDRAQQAAHDRAMEAQRQTAWSDTERARIALEAERVRAEAEERARLAAERSDQARHTAPTDPVTAPAARRRVDEVTEQRARDAWARSLAAGKPLTGAQLAELLGVTEGAARKIRGRWERERTEAA
jgi:hypothetical protein